MSGLFFWCRNPDEPQICTSARFVVSTPGTQKPKSLPGDALASAPPSCYIIWVHRKQISVQGRARMSDTLSHATQGGLILLGPFIHRIRRRTWIWVLALVGAFFGALPDLLRT